MNEASAAEVYLAYIRAETARDGAGMEGLLAPDIRVEVDGAPALASAEEDGRLMAALFEAYPDYHREVIEVVGQGAKAAIRWRMVGHPRPELAGRLPPIDIRGCSFVSATHGRLTEAYVWSPGGSLEEVLELLRGR